jgi:hypothetical protein
MAEGDLIMLLRENTYKVLIVILVITAILSMGRATVLAEESGDMAKDAQNPVGSLINFRFENNSNFNVGPNDSYQNIFNLVPVYPSNINSDWNWIHRATLPIIYLEETPIEEDSEFGLGDALYQGYLTPSKGGDFIWGIGPAILMPTGADDFTTDRWSPGLTAVVLALPGNWLFGLLSTQVWSVDSDDADDVSLFMLQYFINYNLPNGWYLTSTPIITADWEADSDDRWTLPIGGGLGRVFNIGKQAINARVQAYWNVDKPDDAADWSLQAQWTFLWKK